MILALALVLQTTSDSSLATRVRQLADSYLTAYFEQHPDEATLDGVANTRHDKLPDNSPAALARWQQREDDWLTALRRIDPKQRLDYMLELSWTDEPRGRTEISEAAHLLWNQVWYNRHQYFRAIEEQEAAKSGREAVIPGRDAAKRVEEEFGLENLGPWTDVEWGMINGKLSARN